MGRAMQRIILRKLARSPLDEYQTIHPRELDLGEPRPPRQGNPIVALSGVRRCGKTHRLLQEMQRLLAMGVPRDRIGYFDFEDDRLGAVTPELGSYVVDMYLALHPGARDDGVYLFLDGIQAMAGWRPWVRRLADEQKSTIYLAGSTAKLTADGTVPDDGDGFIERELHPYSFGEYLRVLAGDGGMDGTKPGRGARKHPVRRDCLTQYLTTGGFPDAVGLADGPRVKLLQAYESRVVLEDVIEAENVSDPQVATRFAHRAVSTNSQTLSFRRAVGSFDKEGLLVEKSHLRSLLESILATGLMYRIPCFDLAEGEMSRDFCKLYAVDPGLARACARVHGNTISFLLEDAIYLELRRRTTLSGRRLRCLKYRENNHEVDFVTGDPLSGGPSRLYQVAWSIDKKGARRREVRSILETFDEVERLRGAGDAELPEATIIIGDCTPESLVRHRRYLNALGERARRIDLVPAADWLLNDQDEQP